MEIKYEAVFGDQALFDGAPEDAEAVFKNSRPDSRCVYYRLSNGHERYFSGEWIQVPQIDSQTFNAMRRIIKTPVWTVADQKAGRLPEVGSKLICTETWDAFEFVGVIAGSMRWACKDFQDGFLYFFEQSEMSPIESPEEKAARLREEWVDSAITETEKRKDTTTDEYERLKARVKDIYDALLSGELPMPKKGGE